jgi:hypothetical protein
MREWDDEPVAKKQANEENRARLEDVRHRRPSTPPRNEGYRRNSSEARRFEDQRRMDEQRRAEDMRRTEEQRHANDSYHPSEAAHHTPSHSMGPGPVQSHLPPMQPGGAGPMQGILHSVPPPSTAPPVVGGPGPSSGPPREDYIKEERGTHEHAPAGGRPVPPSMHEPERAARSVEVSDNYDDSEDDDKKGILAGGSGGPTSAGPDKKTTSPTGGAKGSGPTDG